MGIMNSNQFPELTRIQSNLGSGRRAGIRIQTVLRVGRVISSQDEGLVLIRNISDQGANLQLKIAVQVGDVLTLVLAENAIFQGQIVWNSGESCGFRFDQEIDCSELLAHLASQSKNGLSRAIRIPVLLPAVIRSERGIRRTVIENISQRGMRLKHDEQFVEGLPVKVTLPSGLERCGVVRWSNGKIAGVMLLEPFSAQELGSAKIL